MRNILFLLIAIILISILSCKRELDPNKDWIITMKYDEWDDSTICSFVYSDGNTSRTVSDSCYFFKVGDTIHHGLK
jgi:hypothetical protein